MSVVDVTYVFRPLDAWPGVPTQTRRASRFDVAYSKMWDHLSREIRHLGTADAIILADCDPSEVRNNGRLRANAKMRGPGVVLVLEESMHGPLKYPCDTFTDWTANLRAIGLALEALRTVDRYGVTRRGEQYRGWSALPPAHACGPVEFATAEDAARFLLTTAGDATHSGNVIAVVRDGGLDLAYRRAARRAHPDVGGSNELMARVNRAKEFIERARRSAQ